MKLSTISYTILFSIFYFSSSSQNNESMYIYGMGKIIGSYHTSEIDSIIFYNDDLSGKNMRRIDIYPEDNVIEKISTYKDSCLYFFNSGTYNINGSIALYQYSDVIFRGSGSSKLIFNYPESIFCFEVISNLRNVLIDNLEICTDDSTVANAQNKYGVGSWTSANNVDRLTISNCYFHTLNAGVFVSTGTEGNFRNVKIINNVIENISGYTSGRGYGIGNDKCENIFISGNYIINAARHSIYQAKHAGNDTVFIENNIILYTDSAYVNPYFYSAHLVVARSNNVFVKNNTILNPKNIAISIEYDYLYCPELLVENILIKNNKIINAKSPAIWLSNLKTKPTLDCNSISGEPGVNFILDNELTGYNKGECPY